MIARLTPALGGANPRRQAGYLKVPSRREPELRTADQFAICIFQFAIPPLYLGYLNHASATASLTPGRKPGGKGGSGLDAITARSAALLTRATWLRCLK
jgi:hypothetical protein